MDSLEEHVEELVRDVILADGAFEGEVEEVLLGEHLQAGEALGTRLVTALPVDVDVDVLLKLLHVLLALTRNVAGADEPRHVFVLVLFLGYLLEIVAGLHLKNETGFVGCRHLCPC